MPVVTAERVRSQPLMVDDKGATITRQYWANGSTDPDDIYAQVLADSPSTFLGLVRKSIKVEPQGGDFWYADVDYGVPEGADLDGQDGEAEPATEPQPQDQVGAGYSFSTLGGTEHRTQSFLTSFRTAGSLDNKGAIGISEEGVAGVDTVVPKAERVITKRIEFVTHQYIQALEDLTGFVNVTDWHNRAAGEVLFLGAEGSYEGDSNGNNYFRVSYHFAIAKNKFNFDAGNGLMVPFKFGWEYLWVAYKKEKDADLGVYVYRPNAAYVEQVYEMANFRLVLGF